MLFRPKFFSIKHQVLVALLLVLTVSFAAFFYSARRILVADKKLLIRDLNLALMDGTYGAVTKAIIQRATEVVQVAGTQAITRDAGPQFAKKFFESFRPPFSNEILRVTFLRRAPGGQFEVYTQLSNNALLESRAYAGDFFERVDQAHPVLVSDLSDKHIRLENLSSLVSANERPATFLGIAIFVPARMLRDSKNSWIVRVDIDQSFLIQALKGSDLSEIFMVSREGRLISHSDSAQLLSKDAFAHPLVSKLKQVGQSSESVEVQVGKQTFLASVREAGIADTFLISQIPASEVFQSMRQLLRSTSTTGLIILYFAFIGSILFSSRLTIDLKKLAFAAKRIGRGEFDLQIPMKHQNRGLHDEVGQLSHGFEVMAQEIQQLLKQTEEKARMENELKTASLLQSTVLSTPALTSADFRLVNYYLPATECSGDFVDAFVVGRKAYFVVADATGHGASAAIVTGVAKSCLLTVKLLQTSQLEQPGQVLQAMNKVMFDSCKGKLLMTMCLVTLDLDSGELLVANAGHESPLCLTRNALRESKPKPEVLFARGERLGFSADSQYEQQRFQLNAGDFLLLYTDGISEAVNSAGAEWGERQLKKAFTRAVSKSSNLEAVKESIILDLQAFTAGHAAKDDVTFSLVEFTPTVVKAANA